MGLGLPAVAMRAPTIGLGVDYSVHVVRRFADEFAATGLPTATPWSAACAGPPRPAVPSDDGDCAGRGHTAVAFIRLGG
jgi:hypothetical protein